MRPRDLIESSDLLDRPDELRDRFARDGYLFVRDLVDRGTVLSVRSEILAELSRLGWLAEGSDPEEALPALLIRRESDENWWDGYTAIQKLEAFHRLAHEAALLDPIKQLIGDDDVLVHPRKIGRVSYPFSGFPTPPHQDFPLIQGATDVFTAWVPFGDYSVEMGPLRVLEGSHRGGLREPIPAAGIGGIGVAASDDDPGWRSADYRAGDVLIFFSMTVHGAPQNEGERLRLSADYRYQSARQPVVDGSLWPHMTPTVPGWDVLTEGWSSTAWIDEPQGLDVRAVQIPDTKLPVSPSRYLQPTTT